MDSIGKASLESWNFLITTIVVTIHTYTWVKVKTTDLHTHLTDWLWRLRTTENLMTEDIINGTSYINGENFHE